MDAIYFILVGVVRATRLPALPLIQSRTSISGTTELPSITMQVNRPVAKAPVSILIRLNRMSGSSTGVWPWTTIFSNSLSQSRKSSRIQEKVIFRLLLNRNERRQACVDEKKISTDERKLESVEELAVRFGRCAGEVAREFGLIIEGRIYRRLQSVRDEGLETTVLPPIIQERGGLQEIEQERLMVPLEENHFRRAAWRDQKIKDLLRIRAAIDVVAKENRDRLGNRMEHDVHLDLQK